MFRRRKIAINEESLNSGDGQTQNADYAENGSAYLFITVNRSLNQSRDGNVKKDAQDKKEDWVAETTDKIVVVRQIGVFALKLKALMNVRAL